MVYDYARTKNLEISFAEFTEADVAAGKDVSGRVRLRRRISGLPKPGETAAELCYNTRR